MAKYRYAFFGTPHIAQVTLEHLILGGLCPSLIVTGMPKRQGRGMKLTETPVGMYGAAQHIPLYTPEKITKEVIEELSKQGPWDFFIVVAYGKILPQALLDIVQGKVINLHPSLLPRYRGPSPLESVLLSNDTKTGVTIMEIDALVDHGPLITQKELPLPKEMTRRTLENDSAVLGASLIIDSIDDYMHGTLLPTPQNHEQSTHTKKIQKNDGNLDLVESDWEKWKRYRAFIGWPGTYFTALRNGISIRVKILEAHYNEGFVIDTVVPENQKPLPYSVFREWLRS